MHKFQMIGLDADDTLWHNERLYLQAQERFAVLLAPYHDSRWIRDRLAQTEARNMEHFGYGIKAFALSMIETAIELTEGRITGPEVQAIVNLAKEMINARVELLEGVEETIRRLAAVYPLMIITKGDLLDQERKISRSGLGRFFSYTEVVSDKTQASYASLLSRYGIPPEQFVMVGNSLRSDILPVLALGGSAIYIPYQTTWEHEVADMPEQGRPGFYQLEALSGLPDMLERMDGNLTQSGKQVID